MKLTYRQCTEEEAKGIAYRCGQTYDPARLSDYKYLDYESVKRIREHLPFISGEKA